MRVASNIQAALKVAFAAAALASLGGCATIIDGTSQEIMVSTNPPGANCVLERQGQPLATIAVTPGTALIKRTKHDITIRCSREGFEEATFLNHSGLNSGAVAGNVAADLLLTAGISSIVDSASGADNQYTSPVNVSMIPKSAMVPPPTAASATPVTTGPVVASTPVADEPAKPKPAKPKPAAAAAAPASTATAATP